MQSVTFEYILENYFISKKNKNFEIYISTISVFLTTHMYKDILYFRSRSGQEWQ